MMTKIEPYEAVDLLETLALGGVAITTFRDNGDDTEVDIDVLLGADRRLDYEIEIDGYTIEGTLYRGDESDREAYRAFSEHISGGVTPP